MSVPRRSLEGVRPLEALGALATQGAQITPGLRHLEIYSTRGLLTLLWHAPYDAEHVAILCSGGMGGLLGPAAGLYQDLGVALGQQGIGTVRVGYRRASALDDCVLDGAAAIDLAVSQGAKRFVAVGHSFGGAVAVNLGLALPSKVVGVVGLAPQSAGCEDAAGIGDRPLLVLHGERDEILPPAVGQTVQMLAGSGEVVLLPGTGHLMSEAADELRTRLGTWIPEVLRR